MAWQAPLVVEIDVSGDGPSELLVNPHFFEAAARNAQIATPVRA
jgi:hypothetical protein